MSDYIEYKGQDLGRLHSGRKDSKGKSGWILVMKDIGALEILLRLSPEDELSVSGNVEKYEKFRREFLENSPVIYTSAEAHVRAEFPFPFGERVPEHILEKSEL